MASPSRLYLPSTSGATGLSPTPSTEWDDTASLARVIPSLTKTSQAFATQTVTYATATANLDSLAKQYVFPLQVGTVFATSDTWKGRVLCLEGASNENLRSQCIIRVLNGTTVQATLLAADGSTGTSNPTSEWDATALTNRQVPRGTTVACAANYTSVAGDYLVIEIGYRKHAARSTTGSLRFGDNAASDLLENETSTTDLNTWIEFSGDLVPNTAVTSTDTATLTIVETVRFPTLFSDDFTNTAGTTLEGHNATWVKKSSTGAVITDVNSIRPGAGGVGIDYHLDTISAAGGEYSVYGNLVRRGTNVVAAGIKGRAVDINNRYTGLWTNNGSDAWVLEKRLSGSYTNLAYYFVGTTIDQVYAVELRITDGTKKVFIDGVERISSTDNALTAAGVAGVQFFEVGTVSNTSGAHLDDVFWRGPVSESTPKSATDTATLSITDTAAADSSYTDADTRSLSITDTASFTYPLSAGADSRVLTIVDTAEVSLAKQADDTRTLTSTDTAGASAAETSADTSALSIADTVAISLATADTSALTPADTSSLTAALASADTATPGIADTASAFSSASDTVTTTAGTLTLGSTSATINYGNTISVTPGTLTLGSTSATAGAGGSVTATTSTLTLGSTSATIQAGSSIAGTTSTLTLGSTSAVLSAHASVAATTSTLTLGSTSALAAVHGTVTTAKSNLQLGSTSATIQAGSAVTGTTSTLTLGSTSATMGGGASVAATTSTLTLGTTSASASGGSIVTATKSNLQLGSTSASMVSGETVVVDQRTLTLSTTLATISAGSSLAATTSTLALGSTSAVMSGGTAATVTTTASTLTLGGTSATNSAGSSVVALAGNLALGGTNATMTGVAVVAPPWVQGQV